MKELEMQNMTVKRQPLDSDAHFDVTKHIRLVASFQENKLKNIVFILKK